MNPIEIEPTNNIDKETPEQKELLDDVLEHRKHVLLVMSMIAEEIQVKGVCHDWTKIAYFDKFYDDVVQRKKVLDFKERSWYDIHTRGERHHLNSHKPVGVNLFDVLEFIVDCICSGKSRSGDVHRDYLKFDDPNLLENAYWNTVDLICENVKIKEKDLDE